MLSWKYFPVLFANKENEYTKFIIKVLLVSFIYIWVSNVEEIKAFCVDRILPLPDPDSLLGASGAIMQWYMTSAVTNVVLAVSSCLLCAFGDELYAVYMGIVQYLFMLSMGIYGLFLIFSRNMPPECTDITKKNNVAFTVLCFVSPFHILDTFWVYCATVQSVCNVQNTHAYLLMEKA